MSNSIAPEVQQIWDILQEVKDPEVPVLSIIDLGIVRDVQVLPSPLNSPYYFPSPSGEGALVQDKTDEVEVPEVRVTITPTYSGCPAMDVINMDIRLKLIEKGYRNVTIQQQLSPAWTTDWMTEEGKQKLKAYGIAPPNPKQQFCKEEMFQQEVVQCPFCNSYYTELISQFSSTACKAM